jgi:hypothetical protein
MQAQKTFHFVSVRFIVLAISLLVALMLASAAGYMIRGGTPSTGSTVAPATLHVQQSTDSKASMSSSTLGFRSDHGTLRDDGNGAGAGH